MVRSSRAQDGRGMVTAELAVATLAGLALLAVMLWAIHLLVLQVRCYDTAVAVARQTARGDDAAERLARRSAPPGAQIAVSRGHEVVTVTVRLAARPLTEGLRVVPLRARAQVAEEPGTDG